MRHAEGIAWAGALDRASYAYTAVPHGLDASCDYIARALAEQAAGKALPFALVNPLTDRVLGSTRFLELDYWRGPLVWPPTTGVPHGDPLSAVPDAAEIGNTWISAEARGTGVNTEAKYLMLRHAFETWGVRRISLRADARNTRSRVAIERLGATCEGVRRAHSRGMDGVVRDTAFYSILDEEWSAVRGIIELRLPGLRPQTGLSAPLPSTLPSAGFPGETREHGGAGELLPA
ncbi:GNAT family protein [Streptomyces roseoviridis]